MKKVKYILFLAIIIFCACLAIKNHTTVVENISLWDYDGSIWKSDKTGYIVRVDEDGTCITVEKDQNFALDANTSGGIYSDTYAISYESEVEIYENGKIICRSDSNFISNKVVFESRITDGNPMRMVWSDFEYCSGETSKELHKIDRKRTKELFEKYGEITFERIK